MRNQTGKHQGSCLCGDVRFEILGAFEQFFLCHCARCRKDTGSAYAANLFSQSAQLNWLSGQSAIRTYQVPSTLHQKSFCSGCGSAVPGLQMKGGLLVVPAGSLDTPVPLRPTAHICTASRADWDEKLEEVPQIEGLPR